MPLTGFQRTILALLAQTRTPDSYLAGGAALHFAPNSVRYSNDLDFFHDSPERVASAFSDDAALLEGAGYGMDVLISQPGFIRAVVNKGEESTRIDWAHDSAWRFMPPIRDEVGGFVLHDVDLAINKTLALAGRDEPRDFIDILVVHERVLPLSALTWAAAGKDPGFTPLSLVELLRRRGRPRPEDVARLDLASPFDPVASKSSWLQALDDAEAFGRSGPTDEVGCLYYSPATESFAVPDREMNLVTQGLVPHFGSPGGVLPQVADV
ncbi:MAG: nucleotidyl transferase AbiEii/AbiGii toxin family protein [Gemmatimonadota bacterium]